MNQARSGMASSAADDAIPGGPAAMDDLAVRLEVPALNAYLRYVRLAAAALGHDVGYSVGAIEALRTAVDEICAIALEGAAPEATLEVTMAMDARSVGVAGTCGPLTARSEPDQLATRVLDELALDHTTWFEGDRCRFRMQFAA